MTHVLPKCFGDLFESVAAAILIDGGYEIMYIRVGKHSSRFMETFINPSSLTCALIYWISMMAINVTIGNSNIKNESREVNKF